MERGYGAGGRELKLCLAKRTRFKLYGGLEIKKPSPGWGAGRPNGGKWRQKRTSGRDKPGNRELPRRPPGRAGCAVAYPELRAPVHAGCAPVVSPRFLSLGPPEAQLAAAAVTPQSPTPPAAQPQRLLGTLPAPPPTILKGAVRSRQPERVALFYGRTACLASGLFLVY